MIHPRCVRRIQVRSKDSQVKTQLLVVFWLVNLYSLLVSYLLLRHRCTKTACNGKQIFVRPGNRQTDWIHLQAMHFVFDSRVEKIRRVLTPTGAPRVSCRKVCFPPAKCFIRDPQVTSFCEAHGLHFMRPVVKMKDVLLQWRWGKSWGNKQQQPTNQKRK